MLKLGPVTLPRGAWLLLGGLGLLVLMASLASPAAACDAEASRTLNGDPYIPWVTDPNKMAAIKEAGLIADIGQQTAREWLAKAFDENITEADVVRAIEEAMVEAGAREPSFATIVASGNDSAIPHGDYDDDAENLILPGEVVVVDLGARVDGWASDETRTYVLEPIPENFTEVYTVVREAQQLAVPLVHQNQQAWIIDKAARDHIRDNGYGQYFTHSLGHGVGLCVHERPLLGQRNGSSWGMDYDANRDITSVADVVTIEPGIYLPGEWGIRIEDDYRVLDDGSELYTHTPSDLEWAVIRAEAEGPEPTETNPFFSRDNVDWGLVALTTALLLPLVAVAGYQLWNRQHIE